MNKPLSLAGRISPAWQSILVLSVIFAGTSHAQSSIWIAPGPSVPAQEWTDPSHWNNGIAPNSAGAVAVFNRTFILPPAPLTSLVGAAPAGITSAVSLGELRYDVHPGDMALTSTVLITETGRLRFEGTGITMPGPLGNIAFASVELSGGQLEFANSASVSGAILSSITLLANPS